MMGSRTAKSKISAKIKAQKTEKHKKKKKEEKKKRRLDSPNGV
jgi:hypothetical protein